MKDGDNASGTSSSPLWGMSVGVSLMCWVRKSRPLTCCPSYCISGWTSPSPLAGVRGKYWRSSEGQGCLAGPWGHSQTITTPYDARPDPPTLQPFCPGSGVGRPSYQSCPCIFPLPVLSRAHYLGVRQTRLNVSSAAACVTFSDSLTSLKLSVLICEMEIKCLFNRAGSCKNRSKNRAWHVAGSHSVSSLFLFYVPSHLLVAPGWAGGVLSLFADPQTL